MRTFRTARPVRLLAATGVAVAALALTACDNGMGPRDEGRASDSTSTSQTTGSTGAGTTGTTGASTGSTDTASTTGGTTTTDRASAKTGTGTSKGATSDPWDPANRVTCNGSNTTVTMKPAPRPLNHMLITVKNTGSKYCDLYYNPTVRFDQVQWAPAVFEESQPQAVVTLAPGESGYAGVLLASADGSGENGTTAKKVTIGFQGKEPGSNGGRVAAPALPAKGVYYDSSLTVTYWQSTIDDALMY